MAVITISRQYGSGGTEVAKRVCDLLNYRYLDKEIIAAAAAEAGLSGGEVVEFHEEASEVRSFVDRLLFPGPYVVARVAVRSTDPAGKPSITVEELDKAECLNLVRTAIHTAYKEDNALIVGRGGQAVLQNMPGVVHVRIEAPMPARLLRIQEMENLSLDEAHRKATALDRKTANYLDQVFDIDWNDPGLYHLIVNTGKWDVEQGAQIIVAAVNQLHREPEPALID